MIRRLLASLLVAPLLFVAASAQAQPPPPSPAPAPAQDSERRALAETLFFAGRGLMEAGRFHDACMKLAESYRLDPASGTLLNLAVCHEKDGHIASAWGEFREALADAKRDNRQERIDLANERIAAIEPDLPYLTIEVPPAARVKGLEVLRNGVPLHVAAWSTELPVDPGEVEIIARAPEYRPKTITVVVQKRGHETLTLPALERALVAPPPPEFWTARRKTGALLGGAGVVIAGAGAFFGVAAIDNRSKSDNACPVQDGERRCTSEGVSFMSNARTDAWISDVTIGLGLIGMVSGAIVFFTGGASTEQSAASRSSSSSSFSSSWRWDVAGKPGGAFGSLARSF